METKQYRVLRPHIGPNGELFEPSGPRDTREAVPHEVAHLIPLTLELIEDEPEPADPSDKPDDAGADSADQSAALPETAPEPAPTAAAPETKAEAAPETAAAPAPARKGK